MRTPVRPTPGTINRRYRATLIPEAVLFDEVEFQADQGLLPTLDIKAPDASKAAADAYRASGRPVLKVERVEVPA